MATALATLSMPQRQVAQNLSYMRIHESSDYLIDEDEDEDDDGENLHSLQQEELRIKNYRKNFLKKDNHTDRRLASL